MTTLVAEMFSFSVPAEKVDWQKLGYKTVAEVIIDIKTINFKANLNHMDTTFLYCSNNYRKERDGDERYTIRLYINK